MIEYVNRKSVLFEYYCVRHKGALVCGWCLHPLTYDPRDKSARMVVCQACHLQMHYQCWRASTTAYLPVGTPDPNYRCVECSSFVLGG